jgi:hypothetical protein
MPRKLEVSFNSPQCGWMSIGFDDGNNEFHTTTAHAPHDKALSELMVILTELTIAVSEKKFLLKWNRDPEAFDFHFLGKGDELTMEIYQYPTDERDAAERERVFSHRGKLRDIGNAFADTFEQLYQDRDTDEFAFNWRQPFPFAEYSRFQIAMNR